MFNVSDLCSPGTYLNHTTGDCVKCPVGEYQNGTGQTFCHKCPLDPETSTKYPGAKEQSQCLGKQHSYPWLEFN